MSTQKKNICMNLCLNLNRMNTYWKHIWCWTTPRFFYIRIKTRQTKLGFELLLPGNVNLAKVVLLKGSLIHADRKNASPLPKLKLSPNICNSDAALLHQWCNWESVASRKQDWRIEFGPICLASLLQAKISCQCWYLKTKSVEKGDVGITAHQSPTHTNST